jgi:hypothetical protein
MNTAGMKVSSNLYLENKNAESGQSCGQPALLEEAPPRREGTLGGRLRPAESENSLPACQSFFDALQLAGAMPGRSVDVRTTESEYLFRVGNTAGAKL